MARTVIRRLVARDEEAGVDVVIEPGASIAFCQIQRLSEGYYMGFADGNRQLRSPLAEFQARTEPVVEAAVGESPIPEAAVLVGTLDGGPGRTRRLK